MRVRDRCPRVSAGGSAERREQRPQQAGELGALLVRDVGEQVGLGREQRLEGTVDGGLALDGQAHQDATAVLRGGSGGLT